MHMYTVKPDKEIVVTVRFVFAPGNAPTFGWTVRSRLPLDMTA